MQRVCPDSAAQWTLLEQVEEEVEEHGPTVAAAVEEAVVEVAEEEEEVRFLLSVTCRFLLQPILH